MKCLFLILLMALCGAVPVRGFEATVGIGPGEGIFSVTFAPENFSGVSLSDLALQPLGSDTFALCDVAGPRELPGSGAQLRACFNNQRVLLGAIEMYNMDHSEMIKRIEPGTLKSLTVGEYLRAFRKPHPQCDYASEGDLTGNGSILCRLHGKVEDGETLEKSRRQDRIDALKTAPSFRVLGRCRKGGIISFQVNDRRSGAVLQKVEIPQVGLPTATDDLLEAWLGAISEWLVFLKSTTPADSCPSYMARQLRRMHLPQGGSNGSDVFDSSSSEEFQGRRAEERAPDLYSLTTGGLAIQEALQLDRMTRSVAKTRDATFPIDRLEGPQIKSHPFKEMIGERNPAVHDIDALVPETFYSCHFSDINRELAFGDFLDRWGSNFLHSFEVSAHDSRLKEKLLGQLCLETSELTRLFGDKVIADLSVCGADPFLQEGSDVSVIFTIKNRSLFDLNVSRYFSRAKSGNPSCKEEKLTVHDTPVFALTSSDRRVRSYSCDFGEYKIFSNSLAALTRILAAARKEAPSLADCLDYRYMRTIFPADPAREDLFLYLSDAHIRQLVGPVWKIGRQRRLQCLNSLKIVQNAVTLFRFLRLPGAISLETLFGEKVLEPHYLTCPDGGTYSWDETIGEPVCSFHGRLRYLTPIVECPPTHVASSEQNDYEQFVKAYNQYWSQYFDPVGIRATLTPGNLRAETCILPLVETSIYNGFKNLCGGTPADIDLPDHPGAIMQLIGKLDFKNLASWDSRSSKMATDLLAGTSLTLDQFLAAVGQSFVLGLLDAPVRFQFEGGILGEFLPGFGRDTGPALAFGFLMASLNLPVYALVEVRDAGLAEKLLRGWLSRTVMQNARQQTRGLFNFFDLKFYETASDNRSSPVFVLDMLVVVIRWRIFFTIQDNCLIVTTQRRLMDELAAKDAPRLKITTNLETRVNYRAFKEISESTRTRWQEQIRACCLNGLGSLQALSSFRGLAPADWDKASLLINGAIPYCPVGGNRSFNQTANAVQCSIPGDALHPRQPGPPDPQAPLNRFFDGLQGTSASLRFTPEGIMTTIDLGFKP